MDGCLYIAVQGPTGSKSVNMVSGKYHFHLLHKNIGAYIRDEVPGDPSQQIFLVYHNGQWLITNGLCAGDNVVGYLRIFTKGK